ncbi:MAG: serine/threonine protein kinase [Prosthecobacter sp.]|nr:serine/threonine protein kinase [Prosthecobacter sp.]
MTSLDPFTKLKCPFCGQMVRVRRKFDHFLIVRQIGEGGMSRVFEAEDETLGRRVALKILNQRYSRDAVRVEQFRQEALITANVNHPNVIKLYSVGYDQGYFYIAMELVGGGSLEQRIRKEGRVKEAEVLKIGLEVAEGLRAAQQMGLIHRDVKPANILFTETGTAKVVDFGLALFVDRGGDHSGEIWATPYYVAPEKVLDNREDYRSDIFSLGATLYHALTGKPPHKADSDSIEQLRMVKCRRVALEDSGMRFAPRTIHVINRMLAFRPQERCANYDETVDELRLAEGLLNQGYVARWRMTSRRVRWTVAAAAALVAAFLIGWGIQAISTRKAAAVTQTVETSRQDLAGDGVTVQAGDRRTVAERFIAARALMLEKRQFAEAHHQFERLLKDGLRQPTQNWAQVNASLCAMMLGKKDEAARHLTALARGLSTAESPLLTPRLVGFFDALAGRFQASFPPGIPLEKLDYATDGEALLGYLVHGLAEWQFGDPRLGARCLLHFQQHLQDLRDDSSPVPLDWIPAYASGLVKNLEPRLKLALEMPETVPAMTTTAQARELLRTLQTQKESLQDSPRLRALVESRHATVSRELARLVLAEKQAHLEVELAARQRELTQWAEVLACLPGLIDGYDNTRVIDLLSGMAFEAAEIQTALEGRLYLHQQAAAFLKRLFEDLSTQGGYTGRLDRRNGSPLPGVLSSATLKEARVSTPRGTFTLPLSELSPQTLLDAARYFTEQVTDSSQYYQRQEETAAFARVFGLESVSATVAAQLMEENRGFRERWIRVLEP